MDSLSPSYLTLPQIAHELQAIYTLDAAVVRQYRPAFSALGERAIAPILQTNLRTNVAAYLSVREWRAFGQPGDPLPKELIAVNSDQLLGVEIGYDDVAAGSFHSYPSIPYEVEQYLDSLGFRELLDEMAAHERVDAERAEKLLADVIKQSSMYQLFLSFANLEHQPSSTKLNPFWRQVREAQNEQQVRQKYGFADGEAISQGSPARSELYRRNINLDDEENRQVSPENKRQTSGVDKLRDFLYDYFEKEFYRQKEGEEYRALGFSCDDNGVMFNYIDENGERCQYEIYDLLNYSLLTKLIKDHCSDAPELTDLLYDFFYNLSYCLYSLKETEDLEVMLEDVCRETASQLHLDILGSLYAPWMDRSSTLWTPDILLKDPTLATSQLKKEMPPSRSYAERIRYDSLSSSTGVNFSTSQEMEWDHAVMGAVKEYEPNNYRVPARLILVASDDASLPSEVAGRPADLEISFFNPYNRVPYIPGYSLLEKRKSGETTIYSFVIDQQGDPYAPCEVAVNRQQCEDLATMYEAIGLESLAKMLRSSGDLTVEKLVEMIRAQTDYLLPHNVHLARTLNQDKVGSLNDFRQYVKDGKLSLQCTGSAVFLKLSLDEIFKSSSTSIINGFVLKPQRRITRIRHAQVVFSHNQKQYIVDATGALDDMTDNDTALPQSSTSVPRKPVETTPVDDVQDQLQKNNETGNETRRLIEMPSQEQQVGAILDNYKKQLSIVFDVPNEAKLFDYLASLQSHDPARRLYETIRRYQLGKVTEDYVQEQVHYIERCSIANRDIRIKVGIDHYSQGFLNQLQRVARQLSVVLRSNNVQV